MNNLKEKYCPHCGLEKKPIRTIPEKDVMAREVKQIRLPKEDWMDYSYHEIQKSLLNRD